MVSWDSALDPAQYHGDESQPVLPQMNDTPREPSSDYLDRLMRRGSFEALWPLFAKAQKPAKEMTESFSALAHLRPIMAEAGVCRVLHIGDGAHARTAALFALKTDAENISVDPEINNDLVDGWRARFGVRRFAWRKSMIEDVAEELNALPPLPVLVTFVHAHVDVDAVLGMLRWDVAFTLACCKPGHQLTRAHLVHSEGEDLAVLSSSRRYQVLINPNRAGGILYGFTGIDPPPRPTSPTADTRSGRRGPSP